MSDPTSALYDGVRVAEGPLSRGWRICALVALLAAAVVFVYTLGGGPGQSRQQRFAAAKQQRAERLQRRLARGKLDDKSLARLADDPGQLEIAKPLFKLHCQNCHGAGEGGIGPNFTDDFQLYGEDRVALFNTIKSGVPAKGMIAWGQVLEVPQMISLTLYVASLRDRSIKGGKKPEGRKIKPYERF